MKKNLTVVVIEDHPMANIAIEAILRTHNMDIIAEADDGAKGIAAVEELRPDIVIVDIDIPIINGVSVIESIREKNIVCIIIVLTSKSDFFYGKKCAEAGAHAFVSKKKGMGNLINAINAALEGYSYFPYSVNQYIASKTTNEKMMELLSAQERQVMLFLLNGLSLKKISAEMEINYKTVCTYKSRMMEKLGCKSLVELYEFSEKNNIT